MERIYGYLTYKVNNFFLVICINFNPPSLHLLTISHSYPQPFNTYIIGLEGIRKQKVNMLLAFLTMHYCNSKNSVFQISDHMRICMWTFGCFYFWFCFLLFVHSNSTLFKQYCSISNYLIRL